MRRLSLLLAVLALGACTPATALPTPAARATADRPDDSPELQAHVVYVLPADAPDLALDTSSELITYLHYLQAWMDHETGGTHLRLDTAGGLPDISFYRSATPTAGFGGNSDAILRTVARELRAAGFADPRKLYTAFYGADAPPGEGLDGKAGNGYGVVFGRPAVNTTLWLHEAFHLLGAVPACAPHADGTHVADADDLMAPTAGLRLDVGRDDYWGPGACLDLAKSPFMEPLPAVVDVPRGWPLAVAEPAGAVPLAEEAPAGLPDVEAAVLAAIDRARQAAGKPALVPAPGLVRTARLWALGEGQQDYGAVRRRAGYPGPAGDIDARSYASEAAARTEAPALGPASRTDDHPVVGVGAVAAGSGVRVAIALGKQRILVERATLGDGPHGSRTFAATFRKAVAGGPPLGGHLLVDGERMALPWDLRSDAPATVYASVPAGGAHAIAIGVETDDQGNEAHEHSFTIDPEQGPGRILAAGP